MMKRNKILIVSVVILLGIGIWTVWSNTALEVNEYEIVSDRIPQGFDGFRIAQVSDLHNKDFGEGYGKLLTKLSQISPDIIVITGDLIDSRQTDLEVALEFAWQAGKIARTYYVSGNHEARVPEYEDLKKGLVKAGVVILENQKTKIFREGESITLMGIDDPSFLKASVSGDSEDAVRQVITELRDGSDGYTVLLSHRPELFDLYADAEIDLTFSGHAHGGQFRLPLIGGLVAPDQGFFPKYDAGRFTEGSTTMLVSRGVGNSIIPIRFNNPPEIVVAELQLP